MIEQEISILRKLTHPNIIRLIEAYQDSKYFHFVTEYCSGGELFDRIIDKKKFSERDAAWVIQNVLAAVKHLHD